jgi:hypothetical protein
VAHLPISGITREMLDLDEVQLRFLTDDLTVRLYLNDIEDIVRILVNAGIRMKGQQREVGIDPSVKVEYWDDKRMYDDINDLPKFVRGDYLKIRVTISDYYQARFWIESHWKNLDIRGPNHNEKIAIYDQIDTIMRARKLYWRTFVDGISGVVLLFALWLVLIPVVARLFRHSLPTGLAYFAAFFLTMYAFAGVIWVFGRGNVIVFRNSFEQAEIRRDTLGKYVFEAVKLVIAFGLGMLSLYLKQKLSP